MPDARSIIECNLDLNIGFKIYMMALRLNHYF